MSNLKIGEVVRMSGAGLWVVIDNSSWYGNILSLDYAQGNLDPEKPVWRAKAGRTGNSATGRLATAEEIQAVVRVVGIGWPDDDEPPRITAFLRYASSLGCEMTPAQTAQLL